VADGNDQGGAVVALAAGRRELPRMASRFSWRPPPELLFLVTATNPSNSCLPNLLLPVSSLSPSNEIPFLFITLLNECVSGDDSSFLLEVPVAI
jgi:hypothetical protein